MTKNFIVLEENRLDKFLSLNIKVSRNQLEQLIKKDFVKVDGKIINKTGVKLKINQTVEVSFPNLKNNEAKDKSLLNNLAKDISIEIIFEDEHILIINKPYNLTVHNAPSVKDVTLVDWLKYNNISLSTISGEERHGIVHRLDKGTSGVMVVAKTNEAHVNISKQLENKSMGRYYLAIIDNPLKDNIIVEKNIARNTKNRLKMSIDNNGRYAKSAFCKILTSKNEKFELIACKLFTGRTHQIRTHLASIGRHILGDNLYGFKGELNKINRFFLHAYYLYLRHPISNKEMCFKANIPTDILDFLCKNFNKENISDKINENSIITYFDSFY